MAEQRRKSDKWRWVVFVGPAISIALFILLWLWITPMRDLSAQVNDHETRLSVEESVSAQVLKSLENLDSKMNRLIDLHIK